MNHKIPNKIYLQIHDQDGNRLDIKSDEVTWCQDKINDTDVEYVRATNSPASLEGEEGSDV